MNVRSFLLAPFLALPLAGCSDHGYQCEMPIACAPIHKNYEAALADTSWDGWKAGEPDTASNPDEDEKDRKVPAERAKLHPPEADATPGPIYAPPAPLRVWLAPWSRADGSLESGQYVWLTLPGHWTYLGQDWPASPLPAGVTDKQQDEEMRPLRPSDLGFKPVPSNVPKGVLPNMAQPLPDINAPPPSQ
jgi:hypothetical protein